MFLGTHHPRLDDKGRLFLPAKFREQLTDGVVLTRGQERCLFAYSASQFDAVTAQMASASTASREARGYQRMFFASATLETPDKQGRVTIPADLRNYAGLERDCAVVGVNTRMEIWAASAWESYQATHEDSFAQLSEEVLPGLL